jgi:putative sugar O-methyltransferase
VERWAALTRRTLDEVERCDPIYRPTVFWVPGVRRLLDESGALGLETFKSWPSARIWFYPTYGSGFTPGSVKPLVATAVRANPEASASWVRAALNGAFQARRDLDATRLAWDQARWPFDLDGLGESLAGSPPQLHRLDASSDVGWTRPYLNYLLCLAGLSRHVPEPPRRFLELGGGFGVLGEIVLSRDPGASYVDLDLPPLLTVASYYLDTLFGERVTTYESLPAEGMLDVPGSACLPNWRIGDLAGPFDVFVNSYSFQEMEPHVVARYVADVASLGATWIVSLNSKVGKPKRDEHDEIGVETPMTSQAIGELFGAHSYRVVATYGEPLIHGPAELLILRRDDGSRAARVAFETSDRAFRSSPRRTDLRRPIEAPRRPRRGAGGRRGKVGRLARRWFPAPIIQALRSIRRGGRD